MKTKTVKTTRRNPTIICEYCNKKAARRISLNHTFGKGTELLVVENVETVVCDNCGQSYVEGKALNTLNEILTSPERYSRPKKVAVADFSMVA
jgi:YgiT-type zinc finger domain-containing protein